MIHSVGFSVYILKSSVLCFQYSFSTSECVAWRASLSLMLNRALLLVSLSFLGVYTSPVRNIQLMIQAIQRMARAATRMMMVFRFIYPLSPTSAVRVGDPPSGEPYLHCLVGDSVVRLFCFQLKCPTRQLPMEMRKMQPTITEAGEAEPLVPQSHHLVEYA